MRELIIKVLKLFRLDSTAKRIRQQINLFAPANLRSRRKKKEFYSQFITKGDLCFDVGANIGNRTEIFLKLGAKVIAIEPQPQCAGFLKNIYKDINQVMIVEKALSDQPGEAEMMICDALTLSTLSKNWITQVKKSGRFQNYKWDKTVMVPVTTLDRLIAEYGQPEFCKIDVEGYEARVLKGLSQPIKIISFEFVPELIEVCKESIVYLSNLGKYQFNYSLDESMKFALQYWVGQEEICNILMHLDDKTIYGDIYAKLSS